MGGTRREGALRPRVRAVFFTACFTASRRGSFWNPRLPAQLTASPFPALRRGPSAPSPQCRVPTRAWGGRSQGHGGLWPCPRPTRPRRPAQEGESCLKPHPRHSSQRHPGGISRGAWAGLESKASLPAPAGRAASPGPPCRAVPSRAEPGKGRAASAPPAHVGKHMQAGAGPSVEGLLATGCDVSTMTSQLGPKSGAGVSLRGARCPPGRRVGAALCPPRPPLCCPSCTRVRGHAHAHATRQHLMLLRQCCSKEPCPGHRRLSPCPQPSCHRPPGTGSAPAAAAGSCPTGSSTVLCAPSAWLGAARHSKGLPTAARCWGHRAAHTCVGCAHGGRAWVLLVQLCCALHTPVCV